MTHRTCQVHVYDFFGSISVTVSIMDHHRIIDGEPMRELSTSAVIPSTGEAEPNEWLQQALLGLLESL